MAVLVLCATKESLLFPHRIRHETSTGCCALVVASSPWNIIIHPLAKQSIWAKSLGITFIMQRLWNSFLVF